MHNFLNSWLAVLLVLLFLPKISAQNFTINGTLKDASNGEDLIGATVIVKEKPGTGASANTYGFYSLTLPKGEYTLLFRYIGSKPRSKKSRSTATCGSTKNWPPRWVWPLPRWSSNRKKTTKTSRKTKCPSPNSTRRTLKTSPLFLAKRTSSRPCNSRPA